MLTVTQDFNTRFRIKPLSLVILACMMILSSCANKNRTVSNTPAAGPTYHITRVDVASLDASGQGFANQLSYALQNSLGSPRNGVVKKAKLYVRVLPIGTLRDPNRALAVRVANLGGPTVSVNVRLADDVTGATLNSAQLSASSTSDDPTTAAIVLEEKIVAQIRRFVGLNYYAPRPISNDYRNGAVYDDENKPTTLVPTLKPRMADPLLNGEITPQTSVNGLRKKTKKVDDEMTSEAKEMKRIVEEELNAKPVIAEPRMEKPDVVPVVKTEEKVMPKVEDDDDGELCIVTVDNDCLAVTQ
ncbi:MAG: hypothetical protein JJ858_15020 [Rhizobiaceae bacterium]|nr:hypothetical protein [Rhizobiaceae bacterium]